MGSKKPNEDASKSGSSTIRDLKKKYDIRDKYRKPASFSDDESSFGDGKYPPDWDRHRDDITDAIGGRRDAVLEFQNYECARCRTDIQSGANCHHYRPISEGGTHELQNLVALCKPCHKLIHPSVDELNGNWEDATLFPAADADPRVATIRRATTSTKEGRYLPELELLELTSAEGENTFATSDVTYSTSPTDAKEAAENLHSILENVGLKPNQSLEIHIKNSEHSPLRGANVYLGLDLGELGLIDMEQTTDKHGDAHFRIPEPERLAAEITKEDFEQEEIFVPTATSGEEHDYEASVKLELLNNNSESTAEPAERTQGAETPGQDDNGSSSFRSLFRTAVSPVMYSATVLVSIPILLASVALPWVAFASSFWAFYKLWWENPFAMSENMQVLATFGLIIFAIAMMFLGFYRNDQAKEW